MISIITLITFLSIISLVGITVIRGIIKRQEIFGRPPIPVYFFVLAKMLVVLNLTFLLFKGFNISVQTIFNPAIYIEIIAVMFLITGAIILLLSSIKLKKDLVFGLSSSPDHHLQTNGVYSISRHPFYLGFIFILFSSCLLSPHILNISAFLGAWIIHHFIMIKEEEFLAAQYGESYRQYAKKVNRYITFR